MTLPTVTRAQLEPLLDRLLGQVDDPAPLVLVRANTTAVPGGVSVGGRPVDLIASSSPLEIRARASKPRQQPLVVLTGCDTSSLGDDLLARAVRRKLHSVDRWQTVSQLFGAERVSRALSEHNALADALIEAKPVAGYPRVTTKVLDLDTALDALVQFHLDLRADSLIQLLAWGETPTAARITRETPHSVLQQLERHLAAQLGQGARVVFAALRAGQGADLMQLALAADVIHAPQQPVPDAAVRLEVALADPGLDSAAYRSIATAAVQRVVNTSADQAPVAFWLSGADAKLDQWKATGEAWRSRVLPSGFTQRLARAATALAAWRADPKVAELERSAEAAIGEAASHHRYQSEPQRVDRLRMAARLIRRGSVELRDAGTLREALHGYTSDGAWLDRARTVLSQSDAEPTIAALCSELTTAANEARIAQGESLARISAAAAHPLGADILGVEDVLAQVVAPLAQTRPVLVVVLDGMGWPTFTEVNERLEQQGWAQYVDADSVVARPVVAALPTVTELSRTSLLAGTLRSGDKESERRAFTAHPVLVAASAKDYPPRLFHKTDLRVGGLDTIPHETLDVIHDDRNRIVGIVLNNIDERLKDVANPPTGWGLDELAPLREVLDAARRAGRAIVLTADHGHILERKSESRQGGGGERWRRVDTGPAGHGELQVSGPRVVNDEHAAILPWLEQLRYGASRNGYHGGLTLAEMTVPLAVLAADDIEGWTSTNTTPPDWWHPRIAVEAEQPPSAPAPVVSKPAKRPVPDTPSLFDPEPALEPVPAVAEPAIAPVGPGGPIAKIMASEHVQSQLTVLRLDATVVTSILSVLNAAGGTSLSEARVADAVDVPRLRIGRVITQIQRLLNIDGYPVIETANGEVRFDRALLERQLGL